MITQLPSPIHKTELGTRIRYRETDELKKNRVIFTRKAVKIIDLESNSEKKEEEDKPSGAVLNPCKIKERQVNEADGTQRTINGSRIRAEEGEIKVIGEGDHGNAEEEAGQTKSSHCVLNTVPNSRLIVLSSEDEEEEHDSYQKIASTACRRSVRLRNFTLHSRNSVTNGDTKIAMKQLKKATPPSSKVLIVDNQLEADINTNGQTIDGELDSKNSNIEIEGENELSPSSSLTQGSREEVLIARKRPLTGQVESMIPHKVRKVENAESVTHSMHSSTEILNEFQSSALSSSSDSSSPCKDIPKGKILKQGKILFPVRKVVVNKCRDIVRAKTESDKAGILEKPSSVLGSKMYRDIVAEKTHMIGTLAQAQFVSGRDITGCDASKKVKEMLRLFNSYYLRFVQEEEVRCRKEATGAIKSSEKCERSKSRRPDLKAITHMKADKKIVDMGKVLGTVPGVKIGDQFFSRCEMIAIGLHCHWLGGIDTIPASSKCKLNIAKLPVASSIMLSGAYEDDIDNSEDVIYTGQGGNDLLGNKRQIADQVLKRGNLALKNNMEQDIPVRLIRGHKTKNSYTGKVYTYDGLYKVKDYWAEKGISGFTVYKFRLKRIEGQPILTTDQVHFVSRQIPACASELKGLVCSDISHGLELVPIPASNLFNPPVAPDFRYISKLEVKEGVRKPRPAKGCSCIGDCLDPNKCSCAILNKKRFPYVMKDGGRLIEPMDVVYECGPHCGCSTSCSNRVTQKGMQYRLEVFQTAQKGWGVRSWDTIPAGAPVCQYAGILMKSEDADNISDSQFIFELDCLQTIKGIGSRQKRSVSNAGDIGSQKGAFDNVPEQPEFCIDASTCGNVSRLINHSCEPNLFVQCVLNDHHDLSQPRIWFFAADTISPLQELTYDYGYELGSVVRDGKVKELPCYCGGFECRKRLY